MFGNANWIWTPDDDGGTNRNVIVRREFPLETRPQEAYLEISAESRYVLYVNGERVGQGPNRSWHHIKQYDRYEIAACLRPGINAISAHVVRWNVPTGQDVPGPGGFIAELTVEGFDEPLLCTDSSWKTTEHAAIKRRVPRMAMACGFVEDYDARGELGDWTRPCYDDSGWSRAVMIGPVGTEPWLSMRERDIPFLAEEPVYPKNVADVAVVVPPANSHAFDVYDYIKDADGKDLGSGIMAVELVADRAGEVTMIRMNQSWELDHFGLMRVNGQDVSFTRDRARFAVREGSNLIVVKVNRVGQSSPSWAFETDLSVTLRAPFAADGSPASYYAAKTNDDPVVAACWEAVGVDDLLEHDASLTRISPKDKHTDVFALSNTRKVVDGAQGRIEKPFALCSANSDCAVAYPQAEGDLEFLLDFGEEIHGFVEFEINAAEGTVLDFNCFEAIVEGLWSWTDNLRNTIRYTSKEGWQRFHSTVVRGFRYAQVTVRNASRPVKIREIRCLQNTYPVLNVGSFKCSDELLNSAWEIGRRTARMCMEDTYVDCPAYEQSFWVGDSRNEMLVAYTAFGDPMISRRCLRLAAESLWRSPMPECVVPAGHGGILVDWSFFWALALEEYYRYTGDIEFIRQMWPALHQTCRFLLDQRGPDGLFRYAAWNMLDWAHMDVPPGAANTHENALAVEALRRAATVADLVGAPDGAELRHQAEAMTSAMNEHLWDEAKRAYLDSIHADGTPSTLFTQQTQTMAYLCGIVPPEREAAVKGWMKEVPEGWTKIGSPWMMWFSFEALAKNGDFETILEWTRRHWGEMLRMDATTCWETFASWANGRMSPTRSWCHAWSAAPTYFLSRYQLGVDLLAAGEGRIEISPVTGGLAWAKGVVPTRRGLVSVSWCVESGRFDAKVIVPVGVEAEVVTPAGFERGDVAVKQSAVLTAPDWEL